MPTLYHYVHCPFCVRVRMALGFFKTPYRSQVLGYDDEKTPLDLTGVKMLPIFEFDGEKPMNESLDIIKKLDKDNVLSNEFSVDKRLNEHLDLIGKSVHSLCMPYWIYTPEFDESSRSYFQRKKEVKRGPFYRLIQNKDEHLKNLELVLTSLEERLNPFYESQTFTIKDIMLASHLWGMYIFPEFQFSETFHQYLQKVKSLCHFEYHEDFWRSEVPLK